MLTAALCAIASLGKSRKLFEADSRGYDDGGSGKGLLHYKGDADGFRGGGSVGKGDGDAAARTHDFDGGTNFLERELLLGSPDVT